MESPAPCSITANAAQAEYNAACGVVRELFDRRRVAKRAAGAPYRTAIDVLQRHITAEEAAIDASFEEHTRAAQARRTRAARALVEDVAPLSSPSKGPCPSGGEHDWGGDGQHSNEYCRKCKQDRPSREAIRAAQQGPLR